MSETPAVPVAAPQVLPALPPGAGKAKPLTAIQLIEQEIGNFFRQKEQAIAQVHAIDGAIQAANVLVAKLKAAEAEAKKLADEAAAEAKKLVGAVETDVVKAKSEVQSVVDEVAKKI